MKTKIFLFSISLLTSMIALGVSIDSLTTQLNHVNTQIKAIKQSWSKENTRIKLAEKASSSLYTSIKPIFEKIIASNEFITKMNTAVDQQFDYIVNNSITFKNLNSIDNNLSDFYPNITMHSFGLKLYTAMANKAYYLALGQKLAEKAKEIAATILITQKKLPIKPAEAA
ncbi:MAG TPA: hypothetical protein VLB80_05335 [Candidatus Babeliales bacterium]|nr:hypothetical protein [Candidatus Babeliales bacterium]